MPNVRVVLADDDYFTRQGIRGLLETEPGIVVVGEAGNGEEALKLADQYKPDVLVLDIKMPFSGIKVARALEGLGAKVRVLALSTYDTDRYILETIRAGRAAGYLTKDEAPELLIDSIQQVAAGEEGVMSPSVSKVYYRLTKRHGIRATKQELTPREWEMLALVADAMNNREIATELGISEKTVKNTLSNIFNKIGVEDRAKAARWYRENAPSGESTGGGKHGYDDEP